MPSQRNPSSQGYGTIEDASARDQADGIGQRNTAEDNSDQPNRGLTNTTKDSDNPSFPRQLHRRMIVDVDTRWADLVLILCHYASGLVDSVAYNTYSCFASMQTGVSILGVPLLSSYITSYITLYISIDSYFIARIG